MEAENRTCSRVIATYSLSAQQRHLWLQPDRADICAQCAVLIEGPLDADALRDSIELVADRHEILRTTFNTQAESEFPLQTVHEYLDIQWNEKDPSGWESQITEAEVAAIFRQQSSAPFDVESGPIFLASLLHIGEDRGLLVLTLPSLCADALTLKNIIVEIAGTYRHLVQGVELVGDPLPYSAFSSWQNELERDEDQDAREGRAYWAGQNFSALAQMDFGKAASRAVVEDGPELCGYDSSPELTTALDTLAERWDISVRAILLACWNVLVCRLKGQTNIVIGETFSGRGYEEFEDALGPFARCLPVGVDLPLQRRFSSLARQLQQLQEQASERQDYAIFDSEVSFPVGFEYNEWPCSLEGAGLSFKFIQQRAWLERFQLKLTCIRTPSHLRTELSFDPGLFHESLISLLQERLLAMIEAIIRNPGSVIADLPTLGSSERHQIIDSFNRTAAKYEEGKTLHELFAEQVCRTPDRVALVASPDMLSFAELNSRANQLAHYLRSVGVAPEGRVGICLDRSLEMVVGLLGILKAGAAYVPLDPNYPRERLEYIFNDSAPRVILTQERLRSILPDTTAQVIALDSQWSDVARCEDENPDASALGLTPRHLAYVIYTSGSTGRPKGVMNEHRGVVNRLQWMQDRYRLNQDDRVLQKTPFSFDVSVWEFFWPLLNGASLIIARPEGHQDAVYLRGLIQEAAITTVHFVPSMLEAFLDQNLDGQCKSLRHVVCSGEELSLGLQNLCLEELPQAELHNLYGPTEAAIDVTYWRCRLDAAASRVPIGCPISNTRMYILDSAQQPVPIGESGEIHIGGVAVARGYLNQPDLTAERFIQDPFSQEPYARLYKTGDLGLWREDGNIEYLGRMDNQVKIRGFRIELGEIEAALNTHSDVWKAVVMRGKDAQSRLLVAYVVARHGSELSQLELRAYLSEKLPEYMIPAAIMQIEAFPLMPNGKVDRKAVLSLDRSNARATDHTALPRTVEEKALARIWADVFGLPAVGIYEDFFELGGDSILAIQVVARANRMGLRLTPKLIFEKHVIAELAAVAGSGNQIEAEQGLVTGPVSLTPAQYWFFEQDFVERHHWNQSVILEVPPSLGPGLVETAVGRVMAHHDALRLRFDQSNPDSYQFIADMDGAAQYFDVRDLSFVAEPDLAGAIEEIAGQLQASLNLSQGPIARFVLFDLGDGKPKRLLIVIHHLAVDGISWRILLEDLETACDRLLNVQPIDLPPKTCSFKEWSRRLAEHAESGAYAQEMPFWLQLGSAEFTALPGDGDGLNIVAEARSITCSLEPEETSILLHELPEAYGTQINDILLTAIVRGFAKCTGATSLLIDMEGHGRETIFEGLDISRTVGWFTTRFPVLLEVSGAEDSLEALRLIRDQLRKIPNNGIGYGLLKYLSNDREAIEKLRALPVPDFKFNYLGQFDHTFAKAGLFAMAKERKGAERNPLSRRTYMLDVDALVLGDRLHIVWSYSEDGYDHERISTLAGAAQEELRNLIARRNSEETVRYAPSDFELVMLDQRCLDQIANAVHFDRESSLSDAGQKRRQIEDIYPVSPLQESFLLHSLSTQGSGAGFEQKSLLINGNVDLNTFSRTWEELVHRHAMLRTAFVMDSLAGPLQIILRQVQMPIEQLDWRAMARATQQLKLEEYLQADRERGFDPVRAPLMRVALIRLSEQTYGLVWSYHHLLLDAWCGSLVLGEVFEIYDAVRNGRIPKLPERRPYRDYIIWLQRQDSASAEQFWREKLRGFVSPTRLPIGRWVYPGLESKKIYKTCGLEFTDSETEAIELFSKTNKLTLNTLLHGAWALLLSRYCDTEDVLFGTTVSGRPPDLPDSEAVLGMFINNLPVRVRFPGTSQLISALHDLQDLLVCMREYEWVSPLRLQEWSEVSRANRLFESLLVFQNYPIEGSLRRAAADLEMSDVRSRLETSYPLTVVVGPFDPLTVRIIYDAGRFNDSEMSRLAEHLRAVLHGFTFDGQARCLNDVSMLTDALRRELLRGHSPAGARADEKLHVDQLIEKHAARSPNGTAVKWQHESLTWHELNRLANRLARRLARAQMGTGKLVGVLLNRSLDFAVALVAVLKAGAGLVVLDPSDTDDRISTQLEQAAPHALLTTGLLRLKIGESSIPAIFVDDSENIAESARNLRKNFSIKHLACLHLAPGLERPVKITHEALVDQARDFSLIVHPGPSDAILISSESIAAAALETLECLAAGTQVVIADNEALLQPSRLMQALRDSGASIMQAPPSTWRQLLTLGWEGGANFKAICPSKRLPIWLCRELSAKTGCLLKIYTVGGIRRWLACCRIDADTQDDYCLIGTPVTGARIELFSRGLQLAPIGITGEIYIGSDEMDWSRICGVGAAPDPFGSTAGEGLYRTGDLGRRRENGFIEYRGKLGRSVTIRGDLVDLYEVESELMAHPALLDVAVIVWENADGEKWMGAYIVADFDAMPGTEELVGFANTRLPRYAVPDFFIAVDSLPLTSEGEVDFKALPPPDAAGVHVEVVWQEFCDPLQLRLKRIWEDLFGFRPIGIKESFFGLGGHSLLAVRLMSEIRKQFGRDLPLSTLLKGATVEYLAEVLRVEDGPTPWTPIVRIQDGGDRVPLFCVHSLGGEVLNYLELAHYLGPDQPVYGLQARGFADGKEGERRLEDMAACYLEAVRKVQPHGPYCFIGYSFGGVLALEMAQQLFAAGETRTWVGPLDTNLMGNLPVEPGSDGLPEEEGVDWAQLLLNFSRHGTKVTADDLRRQGSIEQQVAYAIEHGVLPYNLDMPTAIRYMRAGNDNNEAKSHYVAKPYQGQIFLFRASQGQVLECSDPTLGWGCVAAGGLEIYEVPGAHWNMLVKPHVQLLANSIRAWLDRAQAQSSESRFGARSSQEESPDSVPLRF